MKVGTLRGTLMRAAIATGLIMATAIACPARQSIVNVPTPTPAPAPVSDDAWQPLPYELVDALRTSEDPSRDWWACEIRYETPDSLATVIRCPDGFTLES